jgi:hypothetical protein
MKQTNNSYQKHEKFIWNECRSHAGLNDAFLCGLTETATIRNAQPDQHSLELGVIAARYPTSLDYDFVPDHEWDLFVANSSRARPRRGSEFSGFDQRNGLASYADFMSAAGTSLPIAPGAAFSAPAEGDPAGRCLGEPAWQAR